MQQPPASLSKPGHARYGHWPIEPCSHLPRQHSSVLTGYT